jgi:hypothetical protein
MRLEYSAQRPLPRALLARQWTHWLQVNGEHGSAQDAWPGAV